jgi:hypothetical protein
MTINVPERVEAIKSKIRDMRVEITEPITSSFLAVLVGVITPDMTKAAVVAVMDMLSDRADYVKDAGQADCAWELCNIAGMLSDTFLDLNGFD